MLTIKQINENSRYFSIIKLLGIIKKYKFATGLELKDFVYFFNVRHETIMKKLLDKDEYRLPKDVKKEISKQLKIIYGGFDKARDINNYLKRLYPYVRTIPRAKPSKYYLHNCYHVERLKYAVFEILKDVKKADILNFETFMKDKSVKIDMDGISISIPIDKLDLKPIEKLVLI